MPEIPAEAVQSAARWLRERYTPDWWGQPAPTPEEFEGDARELLEASIPFLTPHAHDDMPTSKPVSMSPSDGLAPPGGREVASTVHVGWTATAGTARLDLPYPQGSPAPVDSRRNVHCARCGDTRGGPFGHETSECTWRAHG